MDSKLLELNTSQAVFSPLALKFFYENIGISIFPEHRMIGLVNFMSTLDRKQKWKPRGIELHVLSVALFMLLMAAQQVKAASCEIVKTYKEAILCVLENHPAVQRADAERMRTELLETKASQRPNLELNGKALRNLNESSQNSGEIGLSHTFELGGKRLARIEKAKLEGQLGQVDMEAAKNEVLLRTLLDLQQFKYLSAEADLVNEGISTFEKILKTYRTRLKLSSEQDVSASVFTLALEDYKIKRSRISSEMTALLKTLELKTRAKLEVSDSLFPPKHANWPEMKSEGHSGYRPFNLRLVQTNLKIAEAEKNLAKSEAWPDLKLGPDYEWSQGATTDEKKLGLTLSLPLPIWNRNQGGIAVAEADANKARLSLDLAEKELEVERTLWLMRYESGVKAIKEGLSSEEMKKRHQKLKAQFTSGLVPSSLVIEANRQILEFTKSKNEQELSTLEALWSLKRLQGKLGEEVQ